jgi:hypothetical protein
MTTRRVLLLVGSAKAAGRSTSEALARYLAARFERGGAAASLLPVNRSRRPAEDARLVAAVDDADLLMVVTPLYVDSLPYLVTRSLETLARHELTWGSAPHPGSVACGDRCAPRRSVAGAPCAPEPVMRMPRAIQNSRVEPQSGPKGRRRLAALINCGFPEAVHCDTALAILECFARRVEFEWAGGLALGGGASIDGRSLELRGGMTRNVRVGLDEAADALLRGEPIPPSAVAQLAKPMIPARLYTGIASLGWRWQALRHGVHRQLGERPYGR